MSDTTPMVLDMVLDSTTTTMPNLTISEQWIYDELGLAIDSMWMFLCAFLVFIMQAGFAMLEVGAVRSKNAQNILLKNLFDVCVGTMLWWLVGFGLAFGESWNGILGTTFFAGTGDDFNPRDWYFQAAFAVTTATIVSGSLAERTRFQSYALFSMAATGFIYPMVVHWTWGGGWLSWMGYMDFAGSGVVHMVGGGSALVGAFMVGPRTGRFLVEDPAPKSCMTKLHPESTQQFKSSNVPQVVLGTLILWFGWYGFNCGSSLGVSGGQAEVVGVVAMNMTIAAAIGGFIVLVVRAIEEGCCAKGGTVFYDVSGTANGVLAGLVAVTASCNNVTTYNAFLIGLIGGCAYCLASLLTRRIGIDDPLDAYSIHGIGGVWGVLAVGLFDLDRGLFYTGDWYQLGIQCLAVVVISAWTVSVSFLIFGILKAAHLLRVGEEEEIGGSDKYHHGGSAYSMPRDSDAKKRVNIEMVDSLVAKAARKFRFLVVPKQEDYNEEEDNKTVASEGESNASHDNDSNCVKQTVSGEKVVVAQCTSANAAETKVGTLTVNTKEDGDSMPPAYAHETVQSPPASAAAGFASSVIASPHNDEDV